jgi:hypothetical protein
MAEILNEPTVISKQNAGFPGYLDFTRLRSEGIGYLAQLSGKIWTDHNVHDPGITILETLCYALMDLGYRTNLPAVDLFTPVPGTTDNNFYTPAQILGCNPLTIMDYRKMLVDIDGVRNAWLSTADDLNIQRFCGNYNDERNITLNGLYNVYIELDEDELTPFTDEQKQAILAQVKSSLLAHRNFCEDYSDIYILCRAPIALCADIELAGSADPEKVYLDMMNRLQAFFSPAPQFYTLPQLLERGVTMDEAFAGRPYNVSSSHGFVDTKEFEQIVLKKELHTSDVYNVILSTKGVNRLQSLRINSQEQWKINLPELHVPVLTPNACQFRFTKNGIPVSFNFEQYNELLLVNFRYTGKIAYQQQFPHLDAAIPTGVYRKDLADYHSIQHDLPRVYGIAKGGLSPSAPAMRKAQALQLKGYLLFFDQLLANYLAQLQNVRTLFSMSGGDHTYFINGLESVPDLDRLQRFSDGSLGSAGDTLCYPVDKAVVESDDILTIDIGQLTPATFDTTADNAMAIAQLEEDLRNNNAMIKVVKQKDGCCFYYITSTAADFVLISKRYYADELAANNAATALLYMGTFDSNYNAFLYAANGKYSFEVSFNLSNYEVYLQQISEDEHQYAGRRQGFLDHLLARFAEQFTDYALLSYGKLNPQELAHAKEAFLGDYSALSADRGKGYDYSTGKGVSGLEQRFLAYAGITDKTSHTLCNFEVVQYAEQYLFTLPVGEQDHFRSDVKYDTREEAQAAAKALLVRLGDQKNFTTEYLAHEQAYVIKADNATFSVKQPSAETAATVIDGLQRLYTTNIAAEDVYIHTYRYNAILKDSMGNKVRTFISPNPEEEQAHTAAVEKIGEVNDTKVWEVAGAPIGVLAFDEKQATTFVDTEAFKIADNDIIDKPDKVSYALVEKKGNRFKFTPLTEFDNKEQAKVHAYGLMVLMLDESNYEIAKEVDGDKYLLYVKDVAVCAMESSSEAGAQVLQKKIWGIVNESRYDMSINQAPDTWKFNYTIGYHPTRRYTFVSQQAYPSQPAAMEAAKKFMGALPAYKLNGADLTASKIAGKLAVDAPPDRSIHSLLDIKKHIERLRSATDTKPYDAYVQIDEISQCGQYVYRLVDKDHPVAVFNGRIEGRQAIQPPAYLEIYLGGDIIVQEGKCYYYQLKSVDRGAPEQELVLYQGVKGYTSREEAMKAFQENYLSILRGGSELAVTPKETLAKLGEEGLAALTASYPVKQLFKRADCEAYNRRFHPCDPHPCVQECCYTEPDEAVYFFELSGWQGVNEYKDAASAMQAFRFFLILLQYQGNYTTACDCNGVLRTYLREVMAESTTRYLTPAEAWAGVEEFISTGNFQRYSHSCAYSFFMGNAEELIVHPCEYDDIAKRDAAKIALYNQYRGLSGKKPFTTSDEHGNSILKDNTGMPFATVWQTRGICTWVDVIEALRSENNIIAGTKEGEHYLTNDSQQRLVTSYAAVNPIPFDTWKEQLLGMFRYYDSLTRVGDDKRYYINIPFLQDNTHVIRGLSNEVCERWLINNGFDTYREAIERLLSILAMLGNYEHYRSSFDCSCGPYGVSFYAPKYACGCSTADGQPNQPGNAGEMMAWNPQRYSTSEMACEAVKRAKQLINSEGLHVVEHILLRPHCENNCGCYLVPHESGQCDVPGMMPGYDPYSFIATVVLPAWPERFRKAGNRQLVERLLQREAPAHVLLRILWLGPKELCEFEGYYNQWVRWMAKQPVCGGELDMNGFLRVLTKGYAMVETERIAPPCGSCEKEEGDFQGQLNELFNWRTSCEEQGPVENVVTHSEELKELSGAVKDKQLAAALVAYAAAETATAADYKMVIEKVINKKKVLTKKQVASVINLVTDHYISKNAGGDIKMVQPVLDQIKNKANITDIEKRFQ